MNRTAAPEKGRGCPAGRIYLTGFMGAGKTVVGQALARRLGCPFLDLDEVIVARDGRTIREIFAQDGEETFRRLERDCLAETESHGEVVVATGGGTITFGANRAMIARLGTSVWLDPSFEIIVARLGDDPTHQRPLFRSSEQALSLYRQRLPAYRQADLRVGVGADDPPEAIAARIVHHFGSRTCAT